MMGFTSTQTGGARARQHRQLRDAQGRDRPVPERLLRARLRDAPLAPLPRPRDAGTARPTPTASRACSRRRRPSRPTRRRSRSPTGRRRSPRSSRSRTTRRRAGGPQLGCCRRRRGWARDVVDNYGRLRTKGTAVPAREDFNTLDDPFTWYVDANGVVQQPTANQPGCTSRSSCPSSSRFHAAPQGDGRRAPRRDESAPAVRADRRADRHQLGVMRATHRQNYLVPPRAHRSFPLAELL